MNIIEVSKKENVGKKYEAYYNNKSNGIWVLKEEDNDIFELYDVYKVGITDLYYVSEIINLEFKEIIDWSKIPVDTKLLVSRDGEDWYRRYFAKYENDGVYCFDSGATSFSVQDGNLDISAWEYVKLYEE